MAPGKAKTMKTQQIITRPKGRDVVRVGAVLSVSLALSVLLWLSRQADFPLVDRAPQFSFSLICWFLVLAGIAGTALVSTGRRFGWLLLFGLQPLWITYAVCTDQCGLVLGSLAYGAAQLNGFLKTDAASARQIIKLVTTCR